MPDLADRSWTPGQEIEFRVAEREFRHYTAAAITGGTVEVLFALTAPGPGTAWARALRPGDDTGGLLGPGGGVRRDPARHELFLGDASTIGLFAALLRDATDAVGAVEVPAADLAAAAGLLPGLDVVAAGSEPGDALRGWLHEHLPASPTPADRSTPSVTTRARPPIDRQEHRCRPPRPPHRRSPRPPTCSPRLSTTPPAAGSSA